MRKNNIIISVSFILNLLIYYKYKKSDINIYCKLNILDKTL